MINLIMNEKDFIETIINNKEYIVEMQGGQHQKDAWASKEETQNVDKEKKTIKVALDDLCYFTIVADAKEDTAE